MSILQAVCLGLLQGLAEFLPISSSGHLAVAQKLFHLEEIPLLFDVTLHIATLLAVIIIFRKKIALLFRVLGRWILKKSEPQDKNSLSVIAALLAGTAVTAVLGLVFSKLIPELPLQAVFAGFAVTAVLLIFAAFYGNRAHKQRCALQAENSLKDADAQGANTSAVHVQEEDSRQIFPQPISVKQGLFIGFAQGIGVLPGISRSGITISASLLAGMDRKSAGEFSFLISIPAVVGAFLLELKDLAELASSVSAVALAAGCLAAFVSGCLALKGLLKLVQNGKLAWFAWYLIPLAAAGFLFL
ncbi:MAG: undecaprenyl-diphosphate phosphatase [Bacteroides sp.]|nr:undecaprenyl-diphosphate phosphatase [Prevotella sp.]MCM1407687.1 undecaprenyl-diphosphate phosphatase [Treponema brennaborense]MCM1469163.1 undecaprenyl-diphosphate phosphatase [Bacteroides sp.]